MATRRSFKKSPKEQYDKERKKLAVAAWKVFSIFTRSNSATFNGFTRCYTCLRKFPWKELDAGHYRHTKRKKGGLRTKVIDYDKRNIKPQCTTCNRYLHGNLARYSMALEEEYGHGIIQELHKIYQEAKELSNEELKQIIKQYGSTKA